MTRQLSIGRLQIWAIFFFVLTIAGAQWSWIDGLEGELLVLIFGDDTEYAPGYTDSGFRRVQVGMRETEVQGLLGSPLGRYAHKGYEGIWWWYSRNSYTNDKYRLRALRFVDGAVVERWGYFDVDLEEGDENGVVLEPVEPDTEEDELPEEGR